jgi:hypothetical protein
LQPAGGGGLSVAETLLQFQSLVQSADGDAYRVKACGAPMPDGVWQGWLEFAPVDGGEPIRSQRETTQPNRTDTEYWASGLTPVYLEGALRRALAGPVRLPVTTVRPPRFDGPAASTVPVPAREPVAHGVLDPFSVYEKGESLLRRQLGALSAWHLVNIINEHELSQERAEVLNARPAAELIEIIVNGVAAEGARTTRPR